MGQAKEIGGKKHFREEEVPGDNQPFLSVNLPDVHMGEAGM